MYKFFAVLFFSISGLGFAWNISFIKGVVKSIDDSPLSGATVFIEETKDFVNTDDKGRFTLSLKNMEGKYTLIITFLGYKKFKKQIEVVYGKTLSLGVIKLYEDHHKLDEVEITHKTNAWKKQEKPIAVSVVDVGKVAERSSSLVQLINQSSGIKIRQSSGVGSSVNVNINGLQGKAIRFFKDGVPMDYLGRAFSLSLMPSDFLSRVEVYKGVMPASLGADALGGGVNLVTKKRNYNHLNTSYQTGSFNTHQATINGRYNLSDKIYLGLSSYFTHSDNDYKVEADYVNPETANAEKRMVRRFHDKISSYFINPVVGVRDIKLADKLEFGWNHFDLKSDFQHGIMMMDPYGDVVWGENSNIYTLDYSKKWNAFRLKYFISVNRRREFFTDVSDYRYDWFGEKTENKNKTYGEVRAYKVLLNLKYKNIISRLNLEYDLSKNHSLVFNHVYSYNHRIGSDPHGAKVGITKTDPLSVRSLYGKHVLGLGINSNIGKFQNSFTLKYYSYKASGISPAWGWSNYSISNLDNIPGRSDSNWGVGNSLKYIPIGNNSDLFIRLSYEMSNRLPDVVEIFGNASNIVSNMELKHETGHNINLGFNTNLNSKKTWFYGLNIFHRRQKNLIILVPNAVENLGIHKNWDTTGSFGLEMNIKGEIMTHLSVNTNFTVQNLRRFPQGNRLPNIPYLFSNANVNYDLLRGVFKDNDRLSVYLNHSFTYRYYLLEIPRVLEGDGFFSKPKVKNDKTIIPSQNALNFGVSYSKGLPFSLNLEVRNLLNAKLYDKFRVQKPGTAVYLKLVYSLNGK